LHIFADAFLDEFYAAAEAGFAEIARGDHGAAADGFGEHVVADGAFVSLIGGFEEDDGMEFVGNA
jgi:hypothetical protein